MIALMLMSALAAAPSPDEPVAQVGTNTITARQLRERAAATRGAGGTAELEPLVQDLINEALMADEGYKHGLAKDPEVVARVEAETRRLAAKRLSETGIGEAAKVSDSELLELYHGNGDRAHLELIVLASEAQAKAALERLTKGGKVAEEAKHSLDPDTRATGDYGTRSRGQLQPALAAVAFTAPVGAFSGPIQLELGWGVVRVVSREVADAATFATQRDGLRKFAEAQMAARYRTHYLKQLRKESGVALDSPFLESTGTRLDATPAEADHPVATIAGRAIRYAAVLDDVRALSQGKQGGHMSGPSVKIDFAWRLVDQVLLEDAAMKRGLGNDPVVRAQMKSFEREEIVRVSAGRLRKSVAAASGAEVEAWYRSHLDQFKVPAHRICSHLLVQEQDMAEKLRQRAAKGEAFEDLARSYSRDEGSAPSGGLLGSLDDDRIALFAKSEPVLAAAFRNAKPGQVGAPVKTHLGWHLVKCGETFAATATPLDQVKAAIGARMAAERGQDLLRQHFAELRAQAKITIDRAAFDRVGRTP